MATKASILCALPCAALVAVIAALAPSSMVYAGTATSGAASDGARYGQAAGAALVCYGLATTPLAATLRDRYHDAELAVFDAQAGKVLEAWKATQRCENAGGPNPCKLSHVWSCQEALKEIGPQGTAVPGLVVQKE
ncbi:hypothetical protein [uncultured Hyphomicrobium sp.]|uniref:hypothetical protein n=1 Tax=uncultured Hyphomicrobium sp. TaxID=194373 RepID=UPI0025E3CA4E|nr:hypothetical protein [uncultured Hyphomicrobium sp.]